MRASLVAIALACLPATLLMGCEGCTPVIEEPRAPCELPDGQVLSIGNTGPAGDGCNTCVCTGAEKLDCTTRACNDAGPEQDDAGPQPEDAGTITDAGVGEGPCHDEDNDGFYSCVDPDHPERPSPIDCDDQRFHVQPGGIEFPDTTEDDNCDGFNTDYVTCDCGGLASNPRDLASAMDLCGDVIVDATKNGAPVQFGVVDAYQGVIEERVRVRVDDPADPIVVIGNSCLMTLSSGTATGPDDGQGPGACNFQDPDPALGSGGSGDQICDLAQVHLTLRAPANAHGFAFDFMFLSYEWPEFLCQVFNDTFYAIVETDAVFDGAATNAAFDTAGQPITVNVGFFENPPEWTVPLEGISHARPSPGPCSVPSAPGCQLPAYCNEPNFDARNGSGSGWLTTTVPIAPGEQDIKLTLSIHDESDSILDSIVIIDNFRWLNLPTELETAKEEL